ncbi:MAG: cytochrome d ubiquinol oxidase subunit II [Bacillota bacterium]
MLQIIWYLLIGVLFAGYAVLDGFDLGVGVLYPFIAKTESERRTLRRAIGPVWDGNEVWLLTGGGALFAAFPVVYATVFSGFYLALMLVLFGLIFRAVSLEFRARDEGWARFWDWAFFAGSLVPALLYGVAVGNIVRGVPLDAQQAYAGTFFTLLNPYSLLIGLTGLAMFVSHGAAWAAVKTTDALQARALRVRSAAHWVFVALVASTTVVTALAAPQPFTRNLANPLGWLMLLLVVGGILAARLAMARGRDLPAFLASGAGVIGLVGLWFVGNFPALVPALGAPHLSLTIHNASASTLSQTVMLIVALLGVPLVLGYTALIYKVFAGKVKDNSTAGY